MAAVALIVSNISASASLPADAEATVFCCYAPHVSLVSVRLTCHEILRHPASFIQISRGSVSADALCATASRIQN